MPKIPSVERHLPMAKPGTPISLTGSVTLNPGESKPVNVDALRNPSKLPIAIHEIKFVSTTNGVVASQLFFANGGGAPPTSSAIMEASIHLGDHAITRAPTPVNLLGVRRSAVVEVLGEVSADGTGKNFGLSHQTWRLDAPLILRGGQSLLVKLGHRNFFPYPITGYVSMSGRFLSAMPRTMHVPYVAPFVPTAFIPNVGTTDSLVRISTERDLVNELKTPLRVRRFTGRISSTFATTQLWDVIPTINAYLLTVQMRSSGGVPTVRRDTPFELVFDAETAAWECPHVLPPEGYWIATLKCATTGANEGVQALSAIALHGTREERT